MSDRSTGCLSYGGCTLSVHSIIIPLLTKEGLGEVVALVGWVERVIAKTAMRQHSFRFLDDVARKLRGA